MATTMKANKRPAKELTLLSTTLELLTRKDDLPKGCCGVVQGVALTYGTIDSYGTMFLKGCLDKTRQQKLAAGKVQLFGDHEHVTSEHCGTVMSMDDVGDSVVMTAHLFDTDAGRKMKEYVGACLATKSFTGLSVGVYPRDMEWVPDPGNANNKVLGYKEVELAEVSVTPMPAVDGAEVTGLRNRTPKHVLERALRGIVMAMDPQDVRTLIDQLIPPDTTDTTNASDEDTSSAAPPADPVQQASMDERVRALRSTYR